MSNEALIIRDDGRFAVSFKPAALELKNSALELGALIGKVNDADSQQAAVQAQKAISELRKQVEKARQACKQPVLDFGRTIDKAVADFDEELRLEELRISKLVADFQQLEQARVRAEEQARNEALTKLEREKAKEITKAKTHDQVEAIQERYNQEAQSIPAPAPVRAKGQRISEEWEISVVDMWALVRAHPTCVKVTPLLSEIKSLLDAGIKVAGVRAERKIKAGVTAGKPAPAINV